MHMRTHAREDKGGMPSLAQHAQRAQRCAMQGAGMPAHPRVTARRLSTLDASTHPR